MITSQTPFLEVNWAQSPAQAPTMHGVIWPLNAAYGVSRRSQTNSESAQLQLHFIQWSGVHLSQSACTPTALATSKKPTCRTSTANLWLLIPTEEDLTWTKWTYGGATLRIKHSYRHENLYEWSALTTNALYNWNTVTATNIWTSEVHLRRWHPIIGGDWGWEAFPRLKRTYSYDTLRRMKCIDNYRPTQFHRPTMTTTTNTVTMIISEHKHYGQSKQQSTNQAPTILRHPASKKQVYLSRDLARRGRFDETELGTERLGAQALMATLDEV